MFITVKEKDYELNTKLGTAMRIEKKFKVPMSSLFEKLGDADITELISMIAIAAKEEQNTSFRDELIDDWDYGDLFNVVQELIAKLLFSGTLEQNEKKLEKYPGDDKSKNALRAMLGMPLKEIPAESIGGNPS